MRLLRRVRHLRCLAWWPASPEHVAFAKVLTGTLAVAVATGLLAGVLGAAAGALAENQDGPLMAPLASGLARTVLVVLTAVMVVCVISAPVVALALARPRERYHQRPSADAGHTGQQFSRRNVLIIAFAGCMVGGTIEGRVSTTVLEWAELGMATRNTAITDMTGRRLQLRGVNWFGFETDSFAPHGLSVRNYQDMLAQMAEVGLNTVRLPYSNQLFDPASVPKGIDYNLNPDLKGLSGLALLDKVVEGARRHGLYVILDRHRPNAYAQSDLWYTDEVPESRWLADWVMLARHYGGNAAVIGADLHNEPHGPATWGDGNPWTDWRLAAERAGNAILAVNPGWLIIVQGVEQYHGDYYWWGGNLKGARTAPVRLSQPHRLVYSAHDYGPEIYMQAWFSGPRVAERLPDVWRSHWAYLHLEGRSPVLLGEFGGRSTGADLAGEWQRTLAAYVKQNHINFIYWSWNPDSGDTGGLLKDDWTTIDAAKLQMLQTSK